MALCSLHQLFSGLATGSYAIDFTDANGCYTILDAQITQPAVLHLVIDSVINVSCGIANSGGVLTHGTGGTLPYSFLWSNTATTADVSGLALGAYSVILTDSNGCADTASANVGFDSSLLLTIITTSPRCSGDEGGATITVNNGTAPFIYNWSNGDTSAVVANLALGSTTVSVTDANHCSATHTFITSQPQQLIVSVDSVQPVCNSATGSASATGSGGNSPYIYLWSNSANTDTIYNLAAGGYSVTIYDANNCTATTTFSVSNQSGFSISTTSTADTCYGGSDGSAQVNVNGGSGTFTYLWSNGDTTTSIIHVAAGNYVVTVSNTGGCSISSAIGVNQPAAIHAVISTIGASVGQNNGTATIDSVLGGTGPFTVQWSNSQTGPSVTNLAVGTYTLTITDKNGCSQTDTVVISQTTGISAVNGSIQMLVYPNPVRNELSVDITSLSDLTTLSIRNMLGQPVVFKSLSALHNSIDVSGLASGLYTLEVKQGASVSVQEIVVSK